MRELASVTGVNSTSLLSEALRDPDVLVQAMLRHSPSPNPMQKSTLGEAFLKYGRPEGALAWLEGSWAYLESTRRDLLAQALAARKRGLKALLSDVEQMSTIA